MTRTIVRRIAPRNAAHDDARYDGIPAHGHCVFECHQTDKEEVHQQVRADDQRGEIERDEAQQEERERVVGSEEEGVRSCGAGVDKASVLARNIAGGFLGFGGHGGG